LAVSEAAFDILRETAYFEISRNDIARQKRLARKVGKQTLDQEFDRLLYAPSSQTLMAAISCTAFALHPVP
jgi:hypothetical protein